MSSNIKAVKNCFVLVEKMVQSGGEAGITELAGATNMSKGSVHKHLSTLHEMGYVVRKGNRYQLSLKFLDVGAYMREQCIGLQYVKRSIWQLANETNEVAFFTVEQNGRATILYREVGYEGVPTRSRIGMQLYLHQIAAGKAILSQYSEEKVRTIVDQHGLPAATDKTITDYEDLLEELKKTRQRGYALSTEEATEGLQSVAVPVIGMDGAVVGGCAVAGPVYRIEGLAHDDLPRLLRRVSNELQLKITHS